MRYFPVAVEDVDRNEDHARFYAGKEDVDHFLDTVGKVDAEPVADAESLLQQKVRDAITAGLKLSKGVMAALKFQRDGVFSPE